MTTNWGSATEEGAERWQQPSFVTDQTLSGDVLQPGQVPRPEQISRDEERRLRTLRRLLLPIVLVGALVTGMWWQLIVLGVLISIVLRRRIWQLVAQRRVNLNQTSTNQANRWQSGFTDLR